MVLKRWWFLSLVLVIAACGLTIPLPEIPTTPEPGEPVPGETRATLGVEVLDGGTGLALGGVEVELHTGERGTTDAAGYVAWEMAVSARDGDRGLRANLDGYEPLFKVIPRFLENTHVRVWLDPVMPEPPPAPEPPPPVPPAPEPPQPLAACGRLDPPTQNRQACLDAVKASSAYWARCEAGSGVNCHRYVREVAAALGREDARWGLITKQPNEWQCSWNDCGANVRDGYGEDVVAFRVNAANDWHGWDVVVGAGGPKATARWEPVSGQRPGNRWAPVPPLPD